MRQEDYINKEIEDMKEDIHEIKKDVKSLLKFKWQIIGGAGFLGGLVAFVISMFGLIKK